MSHNIEMILMTTDNIHFQEKYSVSAGSNVTVQCKLFYSGRKLIYVQRKIIHIQRNKIYVQRKIIFVGRKLFCIHCTIIHVKCKLFYVGCILFYVVRISFYVGRILFFVGRISFYVGRILSFISLLAVKSVYIWWKKMVLITSELISYHFTGNWYDLYFHSSLWTTSVFFTFQKWMLPSLKIFEHL